MNYIVIVAGGKGLRMGSELPKQFLPIGGKPVLMHTIERFHEYDNALKIILVLPKDQQEMWQELCEKHAFSIEHKIADGGATRFESSKSGLSLIPEGDDGLVGFHDGVRPFVSVDTIKRCYDEAQRTCAATPVMPITDSLRVMETPKAWNVPTIAAYKRRRCSTLPWLKWRLHSLFRSRSPTMPPLWSSSAARFR